MSAVKATDRLRKGTRVERAIFAPFGCLSISFNFIVSGETLDIEALQSSAGVSGAEGRRWARVCAPRYPNTDYHIHLGGHIAKDKLRLNAEFVKGAIKPRPGEKEPFAEDLMSWLAGFAKADTCHASIHAAFSNPHSRWRSRFNLPFKVTMSGLDAEVAIDGISMRLPENSAGAVKGWLTRWDEKLWAAVLIERRVPLKQFRLKDEIQLAYTSVKMFVEDLGQ